MRAVLVLLLALNLGHGLWLWQQMSEPTVVTPALPAAAAPSIEWLELEEIRDDHGLPYESSAE